MVEEAARCRDDDRRTGTERPDLGLEADAAIDRCRTEAVLRTVCANALLDLEGELASGGQDENADGRAGRVSAIAAVRRALSVPTGRGSAVEELEDGQHERSRLAGTRLGACEEVAAVEDEWDRLALYWCGFRVALVGDCTEKLGREPERIERHGSICS
jgi:hypothetical protein